MQPQRSPQLCHDRFQLRCPVSFQPSGDLDDHAFSVFPDGDSNSHAATYGK